MQTTLRDGVSFDPFSLGQYFWSAPKEGDAHRN
jgi:hypothetical protein